MKKWLSLSLAVALLAAPLQTEAKTNISNLSMSNSHYKAVSYLNDLHAFDYMGSSFEAVGYATRAQVAQVLYNVYSKKLKAVRTYKGFSDVTSTHKHYAAIKWSYEVGVFDGSGDMYNADSNIRRDQLAKVLVAAFQLKKAGNTETFRDVGNDSFTDSIYTLASLGITTGDNGYFKPRQFVTNAQLASFIYRLYTGKTSIVQQTPVLANYQTEYGFTWQVVSQGANFRLKGMDGTKQVAQYITGKGTNVGGIIIGTSTKAAVDQAYPKKVTKTKYTINGGNEYVVLDMKNEYVYVFYDVLAKDTVRSFLIISKQYENKRGIHTIQSLKDYDALQYEMINQTRLANDLPALQVSKEDEIVAYNHSKDMFDNKFIGHGNLLGQSPMDRYEAYGSGKFSMVGENVAAGYQNAIFAFEGWHNSSGHRQNILGADFTHVAVSTNGGTDADLKNSSPLFMTQMFFE